MRNVWHAVQNPRVCIVGGKGEVREVRIEVRRYRGAAVVRDARDATVLTIDVTETRWCAAFLEEKICYLEHENYGHVSHLVSGYSKKEAPHSASGVVWWTALGL